MRPERLKQNGVRSQTDAVLSDNIRDRQLHAAAVRVAMPARVVEGCHHQAPADLQALVDVGRGDVPLRIYASAAQAAQPQDRQCGDGAGRAAVHAAAVRGQQRITATRHEQALPFEGRSPAALAAVSVM